ncbi:restriction endonuclease [Sinirhodobacter ferrireducens]|uniref:Restriction endonuclease n=1 Tax=Paenirhodobacter ferrireducens TaxID=1215032 RepID=A0A443LL06_9RHOB|nr:type II restriction endonuclease [Sinirhodobacter ferrireducens]RWR49870.1 restriction endonuclease [Sinirhodobacter ferrireducens]
MNEQGIFDFDGEGSGQAGLLTDLLGRAERVLVKKLSNNDRDWARYANKHQAGIYIPADHRDGGFFPALEEKEREDPAARPIREALFDTVWPQALDGRQNRKARIVHYTSKGPETHMTRLPKECFGQLSPASFLVMGRYGKEQGTVYECLTVDSASDEAELLLAQLDIPPDFLIGEFEPAAIRAQEQDRVLDFASELIAAWQAGTIADFARTSAMPGTEDLARRALARYLEIHGLEVLDPFAIERPGDALREISRSIEWEMFRTFQRRERAVDLVRIVLGDAPRGMTVAEMIRQLVNELPRIDALMLSASQQRKSRAGYSYEHHIEAMLRGGQIPFEKQVVIEAKKRPDFILPSLAFVSRADALAATGLILSAKTTLRERWKQVEREKGNRRLYLTTVDENIAGNAIQDMEGIGVQLVIPESLMDARETEYAGHQNVLTFRRFCDEIVQPNLEAWRGVA